MNRNTLSMVPMFGFIMLPPFKAFNESISFMASLASWVGRLALVVDDLPVHGISQLQQARAPSLIRQGTGEGATVPIKHRDSIILGVAKGGIASGGVLAITAGIELRATCLALV